MEDVVVYPLVLFVLTLARKGESHPAVVTVFPSPTATVVNLKCPLFTETFTWFASDVTSFSLSSISFASPLAV